VIELPPMNFCSYIWDNPHGKKRLRFVVVEERKSQQYLSELEKNRVSAELRYINGDIKDPLFISRSFLYSPESQSYNPLEVGRKKNLPFSYRGQTGELFAHARIVAGSRILSFYDSPWRMGQLQIENSHIGGYWKNTSIQLAAEGAAFHLIDDYPREICSIMARELTVYKEKGKIEITTMLRNIQVDSMLSSALYPIVLQQVPIGIDRREHFIQYFKLPSKIYVSGNKLLTRKSQFWLQHDEVPCPVFEFRLSYRPQNNMTWIPNSVIQISPMKVQIELEYVLRIVDLFLDSISANKYDGIIEKDAIDKLEEVQGKLQYHTLGQKRFLTYVENLVIAPFQIQLELDIKPEARDASTGEDDVEEQPVLALSSMGKSTNSSVASGVLSWVTNVSSVFAHVSPTFQFKMVSRSNYYGNGDALLEDIGRYYIHQGILQGYKVLFSMRILGEPTRLLEMYRTGFVDIVATTKEEIEQHGKEGVGKGVSSFLTNVFGGTSFFVGKISGSLADLLSSVATNEFSSDAYMPKSAISNKPPAHAIDGFIQGTVFTSKTLISGFAGLIGNPYRGFKKGSVIATVKGTASGIGGLLAAPVVGSLGFIAKTSEGIGETFKLLELSVIESRCRPNRIVRWGASIGSLGLPFLKAIGIRVHVMRYQRKRNSNGKSERNDNPINARDFKRVKAEEEKRQNPKRKVISIMRVKDKFHHLTRASKPKLLVDEGDQSASKISRYAVIFEETIIIRCADLQLSDHIVINFWNYSTLKRLTTNNKPISECRVTVGDIHASMENFYRAGLQQIELNLTHHSNAINRKKIVKSGLSFVSEGTLSDIAEMRGFKTTGRELFIDSNKATVLTPCVQEFTMMRPSIKKRNRSDERMNAAIQREIASIQKEEEEALEFFDSDSSYSSDSSFSMDGKPRKTEVLDLEQISRRIEHLHGTVTLSFFPIIW